MILHGLGSRNFRYLEWYAQALARRGYVTAMPVLPFMFERTPEGEKSGYRYLTDGPIETVGDFHMAVVDTRRTIDLLEELFGLPVYAMGFSFGGMILTIVMAVDERIRKGVLVASGGNFYHTVWKGATTFVVRRKYRQHPEYGCNRRVCFEARRSLKEYIASLKSVEDVERKVPQKLCFLYDPVVYARFVGKEKVMMVGTIFDVFVPPSAVKSLWEAFGRPKIVWLPCGHQTVILLSPIVLRIALRFFREGEPDG